MSVIILVLALIFRITNLDLIEFKTDEATNMFLASRPLFGHSMPPAATASSVGILNPPLLNYLLFPLAAISLDPVVVSGMIALINSFAIVGYFYSIKKFFHIRLAVISTLLIAISPWMILYSRKIWAQDFIFPFSAALMFAVLKITRDSDSRYWILYISACLFLIQLHQASIIFLAVLTLGFLGQKIFHVRYALIGLFIGCIPLLPFLTYQISTGCPDCTRLIHAREKRAPHPVSAHFLRPFQLVSAGNFRFELGDDIIHFAEKHPLSHNARLVSYLVYLLLPLGMFLWWKNEKNLRFIAAACILLPVFYYILKIEQPIHYYLIASPFLFLLVSYPVSRFPRLLSVYAAILVSFAVFSYGFETFLRENNGASGDYGHTYAWYAKGRKTDFEHIMNDPHYHEMYIASFIDTRFWRGTMPTPEMLYRSYRTELYLDTLILRLEAVPLDSVTYLELFSYFTKHPSRETLKHLDTLRNTHPVFQKLYQEVSNAHRDMIRYE